MSSAKLSGTYIKVKIQGFNSVMHKLSFVELWGSLVMGNSGHDIQIICVPSSIFPALLKHKGNTIHFQRMPPLCIR